MNSGGLHDIIELEENDDILPSGADAGAAEQPPLVGADDDKKTDPSGGCSSTSSSLEREFEGIKEQGKELLDNFVNVLKTALEKDDDIIASLASLRDSALAAEEYHRKKLECIEKSLGEVMSAFASGTSN